MNWADWTFRCSDGTEYAIDAEGNVLLPEGRKITKGESFTVGLRSAPDIVRIPNGVTRNPSRPVHFATDDFVKMRVEAPGWQESVTNVEWFDEMVRRAYVRDNERFNRGMFDFGWSRYSVEDDEVKVERIDPRTVYFEDVSRDLRVAHFDTLRDLEAVLPAIDNERRFAVVGEHANVSWNSPPRFVDPPPPYVRYRDPQSRLTCVAVAVKLLLQDSP